MGNFNKNSTKDWVRLAARLGLLFTDPKVRSVVGEHVSAVGNRVKDHVSDLTDSVSDRYGDVSESVSSKYEDAVDRLEDAADALRGKSNWPSHAAGFLLGVGVGAGLGILLAPAAGSETRDNVRDKAAEVTSRIRNSVTSMPSTGTAG